MFKNARLVVADERFVYRLEMLLGVSKHYIANFKRLKDTPIYLLGFRPAVDSQCVLDLQKLLGHWAVVEGVRPAE